MAFEASLACPDQAARQACMINGTAHNAGHGLAVNADTIRAQFERAPFMISHTLCDHPLLQLPRLVKLAVALPDSAVEFNQADIPLSQEYLKTPKNGLSVAETLYQIEHCRSWMVLKNVERDPDYRQLLLDCLAPLRPCTEPIAPGMCLPEAFIFVSSPRAVTPFHCDPEHNFLLQIRGSKQMAIFDRENPNVVTQPQLEEKAHGAHRNLPFTEDMHRHETLFHLRPGSGVHVPMHCPHWVRVDDEVSVSLSVTFRSRLSARREAVLRVNSRLRRFGHEPAKPGRHVWHDELKFFAERAIGRIARTLGGKSGKYAGK
jgi:hypothetical protein